MNDDLRAAHEAAHPPLVAREQERVALAEWRERIGVRVMHAMTCTHDGEDFGPGAVCETCWANTQRIGAIIEEMADGHALTVARTYLGRADA